VSVRLLLALHFHQPVGNFDQVFADATRLCYAPLVDHFERHPGVGAAFHLSGCLIEWLEKHDRPFLDRVVALVGSGRIEPLGGGFYEPILPSIPRVDALDQIERLAAWWEKRCGVRPEGAWIAERVWEPGLAELLAEAGVRYTILDDQHLRFAGLLDDRFSGLFATERAGRAVGFFPSDFQLRYLIPFRPIEAVRAHLEELGRQGRDWVLTYGDDAEKFGFWPGTRRWVFDEGWLERFLTMLEEPEGPARALAPRTYLAEHPAARKVYVPNASYTEMLEWALPADAVAAYGVTRRSALRDAPAESVRAFVRGSLWDMFLSRYPEADQLHKHVLWTSRRARALPPDAPGRAEALTAALRAECNCAYWHGLFGGIYFPHLRQGVSGSVLAADAILGRDLGGRVVVERADYDGDLEDEIILRSATTQAFFRPMDGGTLAELDDLGARFNVTNVMARWKESYHEGRDVTHAQATPGAVASPHEVAVGIDPAVLWGRTFDRRALRSLRDFTCDTPPDPRRLAAFEGLACLEGPLSDWVVEEAGFSGRARIGRFAYRRSIDLTSTGALRVRFEAEEGAAAPAWFGTILFLSLLTPRAPDRSLVIAAGGDRPILCAPGDAIEAKETTRASFEDRAFGFALDLAPSRPAHLTTAPIETLQRSEDRYEAAYQGTAVALCWSRPFARRGAGGLEIGLSFRRLAGL